MYVSEVRYGSKPALGRADTTHLSTPKDDWKKMTPNRQDREKAVKQALANGALEGLKPGPQFKDLLDRYIAGEISLGDAIEYTKNQYQQSPDTTEKISE